MGVLLAAPDEGHTSVAMFLLVLVSRCERFIISAAT